LILLLRKIGMMSRPRPCLTSGRLAKPWSIEALEPVRH